MQAEIEKVQAEIGRVQAEIGRVQAEIEKVQAGIEKEQLCGRSGCVLTCQSWFDNFREGIQQSKPIMPFLFHS